MRYKKVKVGYFYEDCKYHPCLCVSVQDNVVDGRVVDQDIMGLDLVTSNTPMHSQLYCGLRVLTLKEAIRLRYCGPYPKVITLNDDEICRSTVKLYEEIKSQYKKLSSNKRLWEETGNTEL